jgi:hypothetical protein
MLSNNGRDCQRLRPKWFRNRRMISCTSIVLFLLRMIIPPLDRSDGRNVRFRSPRIWLIFIQPVPATFIRSKSGEEVRCGQYFGTVRLFCLIQMVSGQINKARRVTGTLSS